MAKVRAPLLSFGASGTIAKTQTYADWRGVPYARQRVTPANPKTTGQTLTRDVFAMLNRVWNLAAADFRAPWTANAKGRPFTDRNRFIGDNIKLIRDESDMAKFEGSPGALGGVVASALDLTPSSGEISATLTEPDIPSGWTISSAVFVLLNDGAPDDLASDASTTKSVSASPWTGDFTDLDAGDYIVSAWFTFTRPDGSTAYGPSLTEQATAT